jgi:hypothetical protein
VALLLQMIKEGKDDGCIKIYHPQRGRFSATLFFNKLEQESERIPVAGNRLRTDSFVLLQMMRKEGLQQWPIGEIVCAKGALWVIDWKSPATHGRCRSARCLPSDSITRL